MKIVFCLLLQSFLLLSCSLGNQAPDDSVNQGDIRASGTIKYERVPISVNGSLDYSNIVQKPARGVKIQLILADGDQVISNTKTDELGNFSLRGVGEGQAYIRVYASLFDYSILVQDNTADDTVYVAESSAFVLEESAVTKHLLLPSGWDADTSSYTTTRSSAPFAILDSVYSAIKLFSNYKSNIIFPQLKINWSEDNTSSGSQNYPAGQIETSHWNDITQQLYILGQEDIDTDEFDHHVIVHEWGHYFEDRLARADTFGGDHADGMVLDPRLAFSEGFGNALSAMALYPDTIYRDSGGEGQQTPFVVMDIESDSFDNNPGWFSETSVHQIIYDLWDGDDDAADTISLGVGPIYESMVGTFKDNTAATTIFSFIAGLTGEYNQQDLDNLLAQYSISPVYDSYGSGEENFATWSFNLPVYHELIKGEPPISLRIEGNSNLLKSNRMIRITPVSTSTRLIINSSDAVLMEIYYKGDLVGNPKEIDGLEDFTITTSDPGQEHIISLSGGNSTTVYQIEAEFP